MVYDAPPYPRPPRPLSTRTERVALPFWNGLISAIGSVALSMAFTVTLTVIVMIALTLIYARTPATQAGSPLNSFIMITFYAMTGALVTWRMRVMSLRPFRRFTRRDVRVTFVALGVLIAAHLVAGAVLVLTHQTHHVQAGFEHFSVKAATPASTSLALVLTAATLVLLAPIVEEMLFRGLFFGALARPLGTWIAALISALVFGAVHGDWVLFPMLAALGFINAIAYAATGNLAVPVVLHALNNGLATAILVTQSLHRS